MIIDLRKCVALFLALIACPNLPGYTAKPERLIGTWVARDDLDRLRVSIGRSVDDYFVTLRYFVEEKTANDESELAEYAFGFRCRMDGELLGRSELLFAMSWCDHGVELEPDDDTKMLIDDSGGVLWLVEPFRTRLQRVSDSEPLLGTWVVDLETGPRSIDRRELMVVRGDGEYRVVEVRQLTTFRGQTESEAREGAPREMLSDVGCRIEYRTVRRGGFLVLTPVDIFLGDGSRIDLRDDESTLPALGLDGPIYLLFAEERALYVAPGVGKHAFPSVDYGARQSTIFDGSFDGEWRATGSILARGEPWDYVVDASIQAVLDDLYTVQIRCELWPRARGRDAGESWDAFCRGVGDRAGSVALTGSTSSVERNGMPAETQPGWSGVLEWKDGRPRLVAGPGENRFRFDLTRTPPAENR